MAFDPSLREGILKQVDIVKVISYYQPVTKKGREYVAICPFHDDSNPSLHISPEKQIFKCFVCGTGGNAINYVERRENLPYFEALKKVADICGIHDPRLEAKQFVKPVDQKKIPLLAVLKDLTTYYSYALATDEGKAGLDYFNSRQIDNAMQAKYKLGYAFDDGKNTIAFLQSKGHSLKSIEDVGIAMVIGGKYVDKNAGRVVFPICDTDGNVIAYSARTLKKKDEAKYVNTQETYLFHKSNVLYNYHIAKTKAHLEGYVYVLEGFMDVFALSRIGIDSAVALMGTALTQEHIALLRKLGVPIRLCLDGDKPGQDATLKAAKLLAKEGLEFSIVDNQNRNDDPDEIFINQGPNALRSYLNNTISRVDFALNYYTNTNPMQTNEQKNALIKEFIPILINTTNALEFDSYVRKLSNVTGFEMESIKKVVKETRINPTRSRDEIVSRYNPENKLLRRLLFAEREMLYQMLNNKEAVDFYEKELSGFYDETFRTIANYIVDYASRHEEMNVSDLIATLEEESPDNKDKLIQTMTDLQFEKNHPNNCSKELLDGLMKNMEEEREKIFEEDRMKNSLQGKSPQEQARLLAEYNKRKLNKLKK